MKNIGEEVATGIILIDNAIENCKDLLKISEDIDSGWESSHIVSDRGEYLIDKKNRTADVLDISISFNKDIEWFKLSKNIWEYANLYSNNYGAPFSGMEPMQMLRYEPNSGYYNSHVDSSAKVPRIFSAVLYLNDVDSGGETHFERFNLSIKPKEGRLVIFPANFIYLHSALPPISNTKFAAVTWFNP
jgi:prolyl 4-hydroxylase